MNAAHFHLLINHFPVIGIFIGCVTLIIGFLLKSNVGKKIALTIILVSSIFCIPTFASGENAEEVLEHLSNFSKESHKLIHEHEENAEFFMPFAWILIFLSIISLFLEWKKNKLAKYSVILTIVVCIFSIFLLKKVGTSGGKISHPEITKKVIIIDDED